MVFVGINGVGKSTSLAKVAYYLKQHGCNPLIAACDTFRSGAVEQLNVHAKCLDVELYQKGYAKDPAGVAAEAIKKAAGQGNDVVLVDTAGRMQNNVPLMSALGKLVVVNEPDLVCFVGEALVGNDGIDQLKVRKRAIHERNANEARATRHADQSTPFRTRCSCTRWKLSTLLHCTAPSPPLLLRSPPPPSYVCRH